ncbi:conserved hypothetical protein [Gluconacetobacter diazotrophicus PA1 5]|uniref:Uncharacterized protein n=2 Tax=Gluconacetobacter diazotrophicus TaxID=33996 RepID=A0A7W4I4Z8_GLUDI|nr:hypothetical protein [Gluconacetobacter diazotrophicus]ACI52671.1 conserved hypothetical protein [Gluconacetobacter diazotrophicus PA1 5]MBB2156424.1 hypothetical protein [Gluconacetobacter diazotrophicus]TWB06078.1 hypothetical protein FBZ86_11368 [Gluconacetobacter diazotrophicus]CAP57376.1 putative membrane protein [Gluconacetobacter diazotrophicus PA1 5]
MQPRLTFLFACLTGCLAAIALMVAAPHYAGMARTMIGFYLGVAVIVAARNALRRAGP